jgi:hypothetical protein
MVEIPYVTAIDSNSALGIAADAVIDRSNRVLQQSMPSCRNLRWERTKQRNCEMLANSTLLSAGISLGHQ